MVWFGWPQATGSCADTEGLMRASLTGSVDAERLRLRGCELLIGEGAAGMKLGQLVDLLYGRVLGCGRRRCLLRRRRRCGGLCLVLCSPRSALAGLVADSPNGGGP